MPSDLRAEMRAMRMQMQTLEALLEKTREERDREQEEVIETRQEVNELRRERDHYGVALRIIAEHCEHCGKYARDVLDGDYGEPPLKRHGLVSTPIKGIEPRRKGED